MHRHVRQDPHGRFRLIGVDELSTCRTPWTFTSARHGEFRELKIAEAEPLQKFIVHGEIQLQECAWPIEEYEESAFLLVIPRDLRMEAENDTFNKRVC